MLKPTPSNATKKIKLAHRLLIVLLVMAALAAGVLMTAMRRQEPARDVIQLGRALHFEVVDTPILQQKGLSDRSRLSRNTAMLFTYDKPGERCIWMKDMRFSIDIVWLNAAQEITRVEHRVAPETYPETFCAANTQYVIEMNAGQAKSFDLSVGRRASLDR